MFLVSFHKIILTNVLICLSSKSKAFNGNNYDEDTDKLETVWDEENEGFEPHNILKDKIDAGRFEEKGNFFNSERARNYNRKKFFLKNIGFGERKFIDNQNELIKNLEKINERLRTKGLKNKKDQRTNIGRSDNINKKNMDPFLFNFQPGRKFKKEKPILKKEKKFDQAQKRVDYRVWKDCQFCSKQISKIVDGFENFENVEKSYKKKSYDGSFLDKEVFTKQLGHKKKASERNKEFLKTVLAEMLGNTISLKNGAHNI